MQEGDQVEAFDPETGTASTQTVEHVWINHDDDLIDLTLRTDAGSQARAVANASTKQQEVAVASHGTRAPPSTSAKQHNGSADETVHTTAKHPWLTTEQGWVRAGNVHVGEHVVRLDGTTAVVTAVQVVPGAATMYNLQVSKVHTFAVGTRQYIVHNCGFGDEGLAKVARQIHRDFRAAYKGEFGVNPRRSVVALAKTSDGELVASINNSVLRGSRGGKALQVFGNVAAKYRARVANRGFALDSSIRPGESVHAEDVIGRWLGGRKISGIGTSWKRGGSFFCSRCQGVVRGMF